MSDSDYGAQWQSLVAGSGGALTRADAEALAAAGVNPFCILQAVAKLVGCGGPTKPTCLADFIKAVAACIGGGKS